MTDLPALVSRFAAIFGSTPTHAASAPGRVNLIGEHTDYNGGFVLPMAIDRRATLLAAVRSDTSVHLRSTAMPDEVVFDLSQPLQPETLPGAGARWGNYVKGAMAGCIDKGFKLPGCDLLLDSTVPSGGGLSSSAAIEVATVTLCEALCQRTLNPVDKALIAQRAEHEFAGVPCGIMDQFIAACGRAGHALLIDCRSHETELIPLDDPAVSVLIINSNVPHALVNGEYARRRAGCEAAAKVLGVDLLRDAELLQLEAHRDKLDDVTYRRARHVIGEIARTRAAAHLLQQRDYAGFGKLMVQSHASLRDDYEVSCPQVDVLVDLTLQQQGVLGSRMTGGGFGGCTVTLVATEHAEQVRDAVCAAYEKETGLQPFAFVSRPADGAGIVSLP
ncbi:MAG: galactokinase [Phycisphaeraceae bacterium]|nr:galactokinase [Phycisphaeraceae bacterium]